MEKKHQNQNKKPLLRKDAFFGLHFDLHPNKNDTRRETSCAATVNRYGKGQIASIYGPLGSVHQRSHYPVVRKFLGNVMQHLLPEPLVTVDAPPCVDVSLRRSSDKLLIHLSNMAGMQVASQYAVIDFIPPVGPVKLTVRLDEKPSEVSVVPADQVITSTWADVKKVPKVSKVPKAEGCEASEAIPKAEGCEERSNQS